MSTPILTKKQQRQSLSAKKGSVKGLRNILAQPFENYWPIININHYPKIIILMNELLPLIKRPMFKIPGSLLRHMSKEKRLLAKQEALQKEIIKPNINALKSVIMGINAVTRTLEKNNICCILLDANIDPHFLVRHIIIMARNKKIPVLLLPILKTITLETIGFATAAFALKHNVMQSPENKFHALYKLVVEISEDFKPLKCSVQLFEADEMSEESMHEIEITNTEHDSTPNILEPEKSVIVFTDIYRYRSSQEERAFVPPISNRNCQDSKSTNELINELNNEIITTNFNLNCDYNKYFTNVSKNYRYVNIHQQEKSKFETKEDKNSIYNKSILNNDDKNFSKHKRAHMSKIYKDNSTYLPLKVKRIQGNINRTKAIKSVKKKKK